MFARSEGEPQTSCHLPGPRGQGSQQRIPDLDPQGGQSSGAACQLIGHNVCVCEIFDTVLGPVQALSEHEVEIPETIKTQQLVKDLAKEVRLVEVSPDVMRLLNLFPPVIFPECND